MGDVRHVLSERPLDDREKHNSRLFVDLCENIHIHYREYRFVFSLPEYFEFADIVSRSTGDVRNYLRKNGDYAERRYATTVFVAGGRERQLKFLANSPEPNRSSYYNNTLRVELQEEHVTDEIHVHYRDFRLALNRENFRDLAVGLGEALETLDRIETTTRIGRAENQDRVQDGWTQPSSVAEADTRLMGVVAVPLDRVKSHSYPDLMLDWQPTRSTVDALKAAIRSGGRICPVVLARRTGDFHYIIDGHHRVRAALESNASTIDAIVSDLSFEESEPIRKAERLLKEFDVATNHRLALAAFFKDYIALSLNSYYRDHFRALIGSGPWSVLTKRAMSLAKPIAKRLPLPPAARRMLVSLYRKYAG